MSRYEPVQSEAERDFYDVQLGGDSDGIAAPPHDWNARIESWRTSGRALLAWPLIKKCLKVCTFLLEVT